MNVDGSGVVVEGGGGGGGLTVSKVVFLVLLPLSIMLQSRTDGYAGQYYFNTSIALAICALKYFHSQYLTITPEFPQCR